MKVSIKAMRVHRNLDITEASKRIGITRQTLNNWERGKTAPSTEKLVKLLNVYECGLDDIILP